MLTKKNILFVACGVFIGAGATLWAQQQLQTGTQRIPQFENSEVKVWKTIITPNQPLTPHRHENPRAVIALQGGTLTIRQDNGAAKKVTWDTGKAYWLEADPPGQMHTDANEGKKPMEVIVVELQKKK